MRLRKPAASFCGVRSLTLLQETSITVAKRKRQKISHHFPTDNTRCESRADDQAYFSHPPPACRNNVSSEPCCGPSFMKFVAHRKANHFPPFLLNVVELIAHDDRRCKKGIPACPCSDLSFSCQIGLPAGRYSRKRPRPGPNHR